MLHQSQQRDAESYTKQIEEKDVLINELKSSLDPSAWDPEQPQTATNISELNRYKLERLELNNKLLYLEQENVKLKDQFAEFEPFMDHQIGELDKFQKVIKVQEEQIDKLSNQVKDKKLYTNKSTIGRANSRVCLWNLKTIGPYIMTTIYQMAKLNSKMTTDLF